MNAKPHSQSRSLEEEPRSLREEIWGQFRTVLKQELKGMMEQALEKELNEHRQARPYERSDERRGYRNGHYRRRLMTDYGEAKAALQKLWRQLCEVNPSAARSLEEGMEETLTLHRLGVAPLLRRSLSSTNLIESCLSTVRHVTRNVKRWQGGDHIARWTAAGLLEAEKKFRKVKGYRELKELERKLNPELHPQAQVA